MSTRLNMDAFLENPMFLFVDDAEAILPTFRSPEYGDAGRIVELADIGCDTEITFPVHLSRGAFDRHRGGAESLRSTRRTAKWRHERPNSFLRRATAVDNYEGRNGNYIRGKTRRDDYHDTYIDYLDYDDPYAENPHGDLEPLRNDPAAEEEDNYYAQFVNPQKAITRYREKRVPPRYDDLEDPESPFARSIHVPQRENTSPRWFAERNLREIRDTDIRASERKKRTKILSRTDGSFDREAEFEKTHRTMRRERDDFPNAADPAAPSRNSFWNFISFEDETGCEESTFRDPRRTKNHGGLQKMAPQRKRSYIFSSQPKRVDDSEGEEESKQTLEEDSRENLSPKILMESPRYRASKGDAIMEKPRILRLDTSSASSSRGRSTRMPIDERISNMSSVEKSSINMRPCSANEGKKINPPTAEKREEITNATRMMIADDRQYRDKFVNKLSNNSPKKTGRSTRTFNRVADSKSNGRIYAANERDNTCSHSGNSGNGKMDRINVTVSRSAPEEKVTRNERTFALRMTGASAPRANIEKVKKFSSRLPVRTWKRLRTKEPAALRPESDTTNGDVSRKLQRAESETTRSNERVEDDDVREGDRATANRSDIKRGDIKRQRFGAGLPGTDRPGLTSFDLKSIKGIRGSNTARGTHEQRKKRMSVK